MAREKNKEAAAAVEKWAKSPQGQEEIRDAARKADAYYEQLCKARKVDAALLNLRMTV